MSELVAECAICTAPSTTRCAGPTPVDALPRATAAPHLMPALELCDEHWTAYRTDWVLLGWCVDHYAEALRTCQVHGQVVPPL